MRSNRGLKLVLLTFLVFFIAGCGTTKQPGLPVPEDYNQLVSETTGKLPISGDNLDISSWSKYAKRAYGLAFEYPSNWWMRVSPQGSNSALVSLGNLSCGLQCPPQFVGIEIKSGIRRNTSTDFADWIKTAVSKGEIAGLPPGSKLDSSKLGKRSAWLVNKSVIAGAIDGQTYLIEQDETHYAYVSIGLNNLLPKARSIVDKIINTVKIARLPVDLSTLAGNGVDTGDGIIEEGASIDNDNFVAQVGEKRYLNNYYRFSLVFPGNCKLLNVTEDVDMPIQLELSLCSSNGESPKMGVRIYKDTSADVVAQSIFGARGLNTYRDGETKIMLADSVIGKNINLLAGENRLPERWVIAERANIVYVLYTLDNTSPYKGWFDFVIRKFKFLY